MPSHLSPPTVRTIPLELEELRRQGVTGSFSVRPGGMLRCDGCGHEERAKEAEILDVRRLEGQSDPADMSAVIAVSCSHCKAKGAVVLTYGAAAAPDDQDVLLGLDDEAWRKHAGGGR